MAISVIPSEIIVLAIEVVIIAAGGKATNNPIPPAICT